MGHSQHGSESKLLLALPAFQNQAGKEEGTRERVRGERDLEGERFGSSGNRGEGNGKGRGGRRERDEGISRGEVKRDRNGEPRMAEEMPTYSVPLQMLTPFLSSA